MAAAQDSDLISKGYSSERAFTMDNGTANSTLDRSYYSLHFSNYIVYVVGVLITTATIVGNVFVIVAVYRERRLRKKVGNMFIINLAVSDCLVGALVSPMAITYDIAGHWILGETMCDMWVSLDVVCCTASILNLCAIAYDRYNAIVHPMKYSRKRTFARAWVVIVFVWLISICVALPRYLGWRKKDELDLPGSKCLISSELGYTFFSTMSAFFIPLLFMLFFYYKIYCATCISKSQWHTIPGNSHFIGLNLSRQTGMCPLLSRCSKASCCSVDDEGIPVTHEQSTQTPLDDVNGTHELKPVRCSDTEEDDSRRESIEPDLLALYQMRQRSVRIMSNVTLGSVSSTFYSSTDSSNTTATASFSESSDRSSSIYGGENRERSLSSTELGVRRHSAMRGGHRLSSARQSSLHTEVIHEITGAARQEQQTTDTKHAAKSSVLRSLRAADTIDTDDTHDEMSDDDHVMPRPNRKLKSSTFRRRNSRKSKRMAMSQEKRAAKTLGIVMGCFTVCWFPFFTLTLVRALCVSCYFHPVLIQVVSWLGYFNSACNPFIYTFFNKDFRKAFEKLSMCKRSRSAVYV